MVAHRCVASEVLDLSLIEMTKALQTVAQNETDENTYQTCVQVRMSLYLDFLTVK
jgi:hypothetical protein